MGQVRVKRLCLDCGETQQVIFRYPGPGPGLVGAWLSPILSMVVICPQSTSECLSPLNIRGVFGFEIKEKTIIENL